jgi:hypothetical protein
MSELFFHQDAFFKQNMRMTKIQFFFIAAINPFYILKTTSGATKFKIAGRKVEYITISGKKSRHRIVSASSPGMAAQNAFYRQSASF